MRQVILSLLGIVILSSAFIYGKKIRNAEQANKKVPQVKTTKVYTFPVNLSEVPIEVEVNGRLEAVNKIDLFSEVQGIFHSGRAFRPGTYYKKGDLLISIDRTQELASLRAQRAGLVNQIVQFLPDIKFDYPEEYDKWAAYVTDFDVDKSTPELPQTNSEREKFFIAGKNISTSFYNIKNLEARLAKYRIYAPFSGVLTETLVNPGALIRAGQKLGVLMGQSTFELALPIREEYAESISVGTKISLTSDEDDLVKEGKVVRINPAIDPTTQSLTIYVQVSGSDLKEGMFFNVDLPLKPVQNAMEIDRKLLVQNQFVYAVDNGQLVRVDVTPEHYTQETVVVTGLEQGHNILKKMIPAARVGMKVEEVKE